MTAWTALRDRTRDGTGQRIAIILASLGTGALAAFSHPPFGLLIPGLLAYPALMILAEQAGSARAAFWRGWLGGFAYFFISCWWVAEAFLVNPEAHAWMAPFAASLLPAGLALFWAGACALYRRFHRPGLARVLLFAGLFAGFEWLRGTILTGFPWNPAGAAWEAGSAASQWAAWIGVYGLGVLTVLGAAALAPVMLERHRGPLALAAAGVSLLVSLPLVGMIRLAGASDTQTDTVVRIVQANIEQQAKWSPENFAAVVQSYVELSASAPGPLGRPDVVIWPEGALPALFDDVFAPGSWVGPAIAGGFQPGQTLIMGQSRAYAGPDGGARYGNSVIALASLGTDGFRVLGTYDKHHLVPFGEYLPAGSLMSSLGIRSLVHVPSDFTPGPEPRPLDLPGLPRVQPLICYESLFPGMTPDGADRPAWIVNPSNDAWYGPTSGPLQNFNLSGFRAIEEGLPMARATPTGVSAMIDPYGRPVEGKTLTSGQRGVIDVRMPTALEPTLYSGLGDLPALLLIGLSLLVGWLGARRRA